MQKQKPKYIRNPWTQKEYGTKKWTSGLKLMADTQSIESEWKRKVELAITWGLVTRVKPSEWRTGLASNGFRRRSNLLIAIFVWPRKLGLEVGGESWETGRTHNMKLEEKRREEKTVRGSASAFWYKQRSAEPGFEMIVSRVGSGFRAFFLFKLLNWLLYVQNWVKL